MQLFCFSTEQLLHNRTFVLLFDPLSYIRQLSILNLPIAFHTLLPTKKSKGANTWTQ